MTRPADNPGTALAIHQDGDPRLPAPVDLGRLETYLQQITNPRALALQNQLAAAYDAAVASLVGPNDVQVDGGRTFKKKSAWRKIGRYFGISVELVRIEHQVVEGVLIAYVTARAVAPWGQTLEAIGACAQDEETGRRKITIADAIATAQTRATNRAVSDLVAMGEVSAEEVRRGEDRELTYEEALGVAWPWKGKPAGVETLEQAPTKILLTALQWAEKKIADGNAGRAVHLLQEAAALVLDRRDDAAAAEAELAAEADAKEARKRAKEAVQEEAPAPTSADPADAPPPAAEGEERPDPTSESSTAAPSGDTSPTGSTTTADSSSTSSSPAAESSPTEPAPRFDPAAASPDELRAAIRAALEHEKFPAGDVARFERELLRRDLSEQRLRRVYAEAKLLLELEGVPDA